jgi:hypothetical protein
VALCAPIAETEPTNQSDDDVGPGTQFGFVYLMKSGRNYKIGRTNHVGGRERDLSIQLPVKVNTVHANPYRRPGRHRSILHKRFEEKRKNGEWFELSNSVQKKKVHVRRCHPVIAKDY